MLITNDKKELDFSKGASFFKITNVFQKKLFSFYLSTLKFKRRIPERSIFMNRKK